MKIHEQLKAERKKQGLSIRQVAEKMDCFKDGKLHWGIIQKIENGGNVQLVSLERFAHALGKKLSVKLIGK